MVKSLERLAIESFFKCKESKLVHSFFCLFQYIYIIMNKREIYFLCENNEEEICLSYPRNNHCKHCGRLKKFNKLFEKIRETRTFELIHFVDKITDHILKYKKYYILPELNTKYCNICNYSKKLIEKQNDRYSNKLF